MARRSGRPRREEGPVVTRAELVRIAAAAIGREGLARASMRGIAREAGVSLATLQHHFRTKDLLWKAVVDEIIVPLAEPDPTPEDPKRAITATVRRRLLGAVRNPGLVSRVLTDGGPESEALLGHLVETTVEMRAAYRRRIAKAIEDGHLRAFDVDALIVVMGIALPHLISSKEAVRQLVGRDLDDDADRERLAESIAEVILYGLLPREGPP